MCDSSHDEMGQPKSQARLARKLRSKRCNRANQGRPSSRDSTAESFTTERRMSRHMVATVTFRRPMFKHPNDDTNDTVIWEIKISATGNLESTSRGT